MSVRPSFDFSQMQIREVKFSNILFRVICRAKLSQGQLVYAKSPERIA